MLNQVVLVGRLVTDPVLTKNEEGKETATITLAVSRSFKNAEGEYETDFVECKLWNSIATNTSEYCKKGDIVGVKGRLETIQENDKYTILVIAEKVTFLSSKSEKEEK